MVTQEILNESFKKQTESIKRMKDSLRGAQEYKQQLDLFSTS